VGELTNRRGLGDIKGKGAQESKHKEKSPSSWTIVKREDGSRRKGGGIGTKTSTDSEA